MIPLLNGFPVGARTYIADIEIQSGSVTVPIEEVVSHIEILLSHLIVFIRHRLRVLISTIPRVMLVLTLNPFVNDGVLEIILQHLDCPRKG